jgi:hypothetical protein
MLRGKRKDETKFEDLTSIDGKLYKKNGNQVGERIYHYDGKLIAPDGEELTLHRGLWEVSAWNHFETFVGTLLSSIAIFYSNQHLTHVFNDTIFCHILKLFHKSPVKISKATLLGLASPGAACNFLTIGMITEGAKHRKQKAAREKKLIANLKLTESKADNRPSTETKPISELGCMGPVARLAVFGNAFNIAQNTYVSVTDLPRAFAGRADLVNHPGMIIGGSILALFASKNNIDVDREGLNNEADKRKEEREAREAKSVEEEKHTTPLLSLSPHIAHSMFSHIQQENPPEEQYIQINGGSNSSLDLMLSDDSDLEMGENAISLQTEQRSLQH